MSAVLALDTSVSVPYLQDSHEAHRSLHRLLGGTELRLTGHSLAETYSVLTRLPGDARLEPAAAAHLIEMRFGPALLLPARVARDLPAVLARAGVAGGAVYDAVIALTAAEAGVVLATRDARAASTYQAVGAQVRIIG